MQKYILYLLIFYLKVIKSIESFLQFHSQQDVLPFELEQQETQQ